MTNGIDESKVRSAVRRVVLASAPERTKDIERIWDDYSPYFHLSEDKPGFNLEAGPFGIVLFTSRTTDYMWLLGNAAQIAFQEYCAIPYLSALLKQFDSALLDRVEHSRYGAIAEKISVLASTETVSDFAWPKEIMHPRDGKPKDIIGVMGYDLLCIAAAYCFLHEVQHIVFVKDGEDYDPHDEELKCDSFARGILLDQVAEYARDSGYPEKVVLEKRAISIALASYFLIAITPQSAWGDTRSHPSIYKRITALTDEIELDDDSHFWVYLSSLLLAHLNWKGIILEATNVYSTKDFALRLLGKIQS